MSQSIIEVVPHETYTDLQLMLDGARVSWLGVCDLEMRIGIAAVPMGGIAGVGTDDNHRYRGYARRVLEYSNVWMAEKGYDCATLFGIADFYPKFGYGVCLPTYRWEIATRDAERAEAVLNVRPYQPEDRPAVERIYAENNAAQTGSIVRNARTRWFHKGSWYGVPVEGFVFTDTEGGVVGYASRDRSQEAVILSEAGVMDPGHFTTIVRWAAERAIELRSEKITFLLPPESFPGQSLTEFGARLTVDFPRLAGGMGRILRLLPFLEKTLPEWTRRAALCASPGHSLRLETDLGAATLRWDGSAVALEMGEDAAGTVRLPQWRLMQLAMGYYGSDRIVQCPEVQTSGDLTLLHTLFPRRLPYMWLPDHF